jgi:ribose transport system permease protein
LFLTVLVNALDLARIDSKYQTLVLGAVLIAALTGEKLLGKRAADA